ncbi:MAG: hypothetical protein NVSMB19_01510 [Vulcanimicrobiaceae bacterium]
MNGEQRAVLAADRTVAERLARLSPAKRAFVEQRLRAGREGGSGAVERSHGEGSAPLSFAQELLWEIEQSAPGLATYSVPCALRVRGDLDVTRLRCALDALVRRHETLRTTFARRGSESFATVGAARAVPLRSIDLARHGSGEALEGALADALREAAGQTFDLTCDQLLRATLLRLQDDAHVLVLVWHHVASDAESRDILIRELAALYDDPAGALPPPALRYADFALWQRRELSSERLATLRAFWAAELDGAPALLALPTDRPRAAAPNFSGARRHVAFPPALGAAVAAQARAHGVTPFITLLAAFEVLLYRYSRQDDIVVGTVCSGRDRPEFDGIVGYFSRVLPLRARLTGELRFDELVQQMRTAYFNAIEHADMPLGAAPSLQVMFSVRDGGGALPSLGGATLEAIAVDRGVAKFDLTLGASLGRGTFDVDVEYRSDLFDPDTIDRLLEHYRTLLEACVATPACPVSRLPLLAVAERRRLAGEWNGTAAEIPRGRSVADLVEAQAARHPGAVAVADEDTALTYGELLAGAASMAARLRAAGVVPGTLVAVALDRSAGMLTALLGIWKAGAAYVPIDPGFPPLRLAENLVDCRPPVIVTERALRTFVDDVVSGAALVAPADGREAAPYRPQILTLEDASGSRAGAASDTPPASSERRATAEDLAYVIYTSGSTGRPKGVAVRHASVVNFLTSMAREPGLAATDVVLAVTTLSFDIAGLELWLPLTVGARVFIAPRSAAADGARLLRLLETAGATMMQATPATWQLLLAAGWDGRAGLTMLCGGEAMPPELAAQLVARGRALWNMYGPTETTIWSALQCVTAGSPIRLGRPIANTQLHVLEPGGDLAPFGVAGELHIGGAGVAAGYHGRPQLTAERFVADPFATAAGARLYRTGDLVRRERNGSLEFLGRLDQQVKLRGFRIELGDVEAALTACSGVAQTTVVLHDDPRTGPRLIAYYTSRAPVAEAADLRRALAKRLPEYMVPAHFVRLPSLPLTANGKLDRAALPDPATLEREPAARTAPPQTAIEVEIAAVWRGLLGVTSLGRDDDFFALGGHSLLAVRALNALNELFAVRLTLATLFEVRTIAGVGAAIEEQLAQTLACATAGMADVVAELGLLSDEEALALLRAEGAVT